MYERRETMINHKNFIINKNQKKIFTQSWIPDNNLKAAILLIHGYAGHSDRFAYFAVEMVKYNYGVFALDLQGFGRSDGLKADINDFEDYVEDTETYLKQIKQDYPQIPLILMGHCMGGNVAILTTAKNPGKISSLILTAPALKVISNLPKVVQDMANYVSAFAATIPIMPMDLSALSKDPSVIEEFKKDPLAYNGRIRARMANQIANGAEKARKAANQISIPVWLGHGTEDKWIETEATKTFVENLASEDVTYKLYNGLYHDMLHEPEKDIIIGDILQWIEKTGLDHEWQNVENEEIIN